MFLHVSQINDEVKCCQKMKNHQISLRSNDGFHKVTTKMFSMWIRITLSLCKWGFRAYPWIPHSLHNQFHLWESEHASTNAIHLHWRNKQKINSQVPNYLFFTFLSLSIVSQTVQHQAWVTSFLLSTWLAFL